MDEQSQTNGAATDLAKPDLATPDLAAPPAPAGARDRNRTRVDTSELKSSYCNVCNATSTREEVVLNFGVNHDWDRGPDMDVKLLHRIVLSPYAAKRVSDLLSGIIRDYEKRHGTLT